MNYYLLLFIFIINYYNYYWVVLGILKNLEGLS